MANFKGGFAFNNGAAKVEVEQAPDGTLISCVNPVTGESMSAGNYSETYTGTAAEIEYGSATRLDNLIRTRAASIYFTFDLTAMGLGSITVMVSHVINNALYADNLRVVSSDINGFYCEMEQDLGVKVSADSLILFNEGVATDGTAYAASVPATMTINYHPMPE